MNICIHNRTSYPKMSDVLPSFLPYSFLFVTSLLDHYSLVLELLFEKRCNENHWTDTVFYKGPFTCLQTV